MHRGLPWVGGVSTKSATNGSGAPLMYKNHLLELLDNLLVLLLTRSHVLYQLVIYMHEMMMQHLVIQQQLLK